MALDVLNGGQCTFFGPALPEPFVRLDLEKQLQKHKLLPTQSSKELADSYEVVRRKLGRMSANSGPVAIRNRVVQPLVELLGYESLDQATPVVTREGDEDGGFLMQGSDGAKLRCWSVDYEADLDAPTKRGRAYRYSPVRVAQRVLLASGERVGVVTNGAQLRLLLCDPARPDSEISFDLDYWRDHRKPPDSYTLLLALATPAGVRALPEIIEQARLMQSKVTKDLRDQARQAVESFVQYVLDHPDNKQALAAHTDRAALAKDLWHEGLVLVYRLLFVLKCESTHDPSRVFKFAGTSIWRKTYSPTRRLADVARKLLDESAQTGRFLEEGLRVLFRIFAEGMELPGLSVRPLGGVLFGAQSTPLLSSLTWGEQAVARLLDKLLWTTPKRAGQSRERVHYGPLDVEDLGRVYEALLELEPGISSEPMCRLKRAKLEVVVPLAQGERYRDTPDDSNGDDDSDDASDDEEDEKSKKGKGTKVQWIEEIPPDRFYLRVGLGRKASGSYYTPHSFVRFLVQETLRPQCDERSPRDDPQPSKILKLKVLDPACGSGHFLVEACRYLAGRLYESVRLCDELASNAEDAADKEADENKKHELQERAKDYRQRIVDLPDERDELLDYLPSRSVGAEGGSLSSFANARAEAICRRLVAVHCIYGVDINPLAVELAKLSLWIESHAEGYPLTFLDHRIVVGNSLTGPFAKDLIKSPGSQLPVQNLFSQNLYPSMQKHLAHALNLVRHLEASVGTDAADIARKAELKRELDEKLLPFRVVAAAWAGGVMLGTNQPGGMPRCNDDDYAELLRHVGQEGRLPNRIESADLRAMIAKGLGVPEVPEEIAPLAVALTGNAGNVSLSESLRSMVPAFPYDLAFAEVFHPTGIAQGMDGFDAVVGNPPWDAVRPIKKEFLASFDLDVLALKGRELRAKTDEITQDPRVGKAYTAFLESYEEVKRCFDRCYSHQKIFVDGDLAGRWLDAFRVFVERAFQLSKNGAAIGQVLPDAFHTNAGSVGIRRLSYQYQPECCFSFNNERSLFEIGTGEEFDLLVVRLRPGAQWRFACAFGLTDPDWLFETTRPGEITYSKELILRLGGDFATIPKLRSKLDRDVAETCFRLGVPLGAYLSEHDMAFQTNPAAINMGTQSKALVDTRTVLAEGDPRSVEILRSLLEKRLSYLHEKGTIGKFDDSRQETPRNLVVLDDLDNATTICQQLRFFRLAGRKAIHASEESKAVFCLITPGGVVSDSAMVEPDPARRQNSLALGLLSNLNSQTFDYLLRLQVSLNVSLFILHNVSIPVQHEPSAAFYSHGALRLSANHKGYETLWREQCGDNWREPGREPFKWPVLEGDDARWAVRATIDAVVADAYGLSREQYAHVLSTFSHSSYPRAPELCLAAFDELKQVGLEEFCKRHDPYHDIPLNENLPKPVIDLPIPEPINKEDDGGPLFRNSANASTSAKSPATKPKRSRRAKTTADPGRVKSMQTLMELKKELTTSQAAKTLNLETAEAKQLLDHLVAKNQATKVGKGRGTKYVWGSK